MVRIDDDYISYLFLLRLFCLFSGTFLFGIFFGCFIDFSWDFMQPWLYNGYHMLCAESFSYFIKILVCLSTRFLVVFYFLIFERYDFLMSITEFLWRSTSEHYFCSKLLDKITAAHSVKLNQVFSFFSPSSRRSWSIKYCSYYFFQY